MTALSNLPDDQKEAFCEWFRQTHHDWLWDSNDSEQLTELFKERIGDYLGMEVKEGDIEWSLGYCQGDGVKFSGRCALEDIPEDLYVLERLEEIGGIWQQALLLIGLLNDGGIAQPYHEWIVHVADNRVSVEFSTWDADEANDLLDPYPHPPDVRTFRTICGELEEHLQGEVAYLVHELAKTGYADIEHKQSDEYILDMVEANDWDHIVEDWLETLDKDEEEEDEGPAGLLFPEMDLPVPCSGGVRR